MCNQLSRRNFIALQPVLFTTNVELAQAQLYKHVVWSKRDVATIGYCGDQLRKY